MKKVQFKISPKGEITIETEGFQGESCVATTADMEAALAMDGTDRELKAEFYETDDAMELNSV